MNDSLIIAVAYLLGSIPFGLIITHIAGAGDLRKMGSGNIGATNVLRTGGKKLGAITLLLDAGKGVLAVLIARKFGSPGMEIFAGAVVVIAHIFPVWLKFRGGKGVITTLAVLSTLYWPVGVFSCAVWLAIFLFARISSLSAILAMIATPTAALLFANRTGFDLVYLSFFLAILVIFRHYANIRRLLSGEERRIG